MTSELRFCFLFKCMGFLLPATHAAPRVYPPLFSTLRGAPIGWILWILSMGSFVLVSHRIWPRRDQSGGWEEKDGMSIPYCSLRSGGGQWWCSGRGPSSMATALSGSVAFPSFALSVRARKGFLLWQALECLTILCWFPLAPPHPHFVNSPCATLSPMVPFEWASYFLWDPNP